MKQSNVKFWVVAMPLFCLVMAGITVGYQYYRVAHLSQIYRETVEEISRLEKAH